MRSMKISFLLIALMFQLFDYTILDFPPCQTLLTVYKKVENSYIKQELKATIPVDEFHNHMLRAKSNVHLIILFFVTIFVFI